MSAAKLGETLFQGRVAVKPNLPSDLGDRLFWLSTEKEIKEATTTDAYFLHTKNVLQKNRIGTKVVMEVYARDVPYSDNWGVLTGVYEAAKLLEGLPINVWAFDEGSIFVAEGTKAIYEPLMIIEGRYVDFVEYENPLLGLLSASTSISTRAAKLRIAAADKLLISFGTRRVHPALAPLVERACYLTGFDGISNVLGAKLLGIEASGTMPHSLVQVLGSQEKAWRLFDKTVPKGIPRVALVDTFWDEKTESIRALEVLGRKLWGVRLDTPASRRGDFAKIAEEVRWELDIRGGKHVRILASGRLDEEEIGKLNALVDGYGVGTSVAYPPVVDLSAKIVEVGDRQRKYAAKRGGLGGRKAVYRSAGFKDYVTLQGADKRSLGRALLKPLIQDGEVVRRFEGLESIRTRVKSDLAGLKQAQPSLTWR